MQASADIGGAALVLAEQEPGTQAVQTAVSVHLSPHFTAAVKDAGHDWRRAARLATSGIKTAMFDELSDH